MILLLYLLVFQPLWAVLVTEYTTIRDVVKWKDCKNITAAEINILLDPSVCRGFSAACLKQFNLNDLNGACKGHLMPSEIRKLPLEKYIELIDTENVANISCLTENMADFMGYIGNYPRVYSYYCSHDENWQVEFAKAANGYYDETNEGRAPMLTEFLRLPENIPQLRPTFFRHLVPDVRDEIRPSVISRLSYEQFGHFIVSDWTPEKVRLVPVEYMDNFPKPEMIPYWTVDALNTLTIEQVSNWGKAPSKLPTKGRFARRTFYLKHPCTYLKSILDRFQDDDVVTAIKGRCKPLWRQRDFLKADIRHRKYRRWIKTDFKRP